MSLYKQFIFPRLTKGTEKDNEIAHERGLNVLKVLSKPGLRQILGLLTRVNNPQQLFGLTFPNPVGLSAGFDKNAAVLPGLASFGFGFIEAGTVTYEPQQGNPRPRMFRLEEDEGLVNRMSFNNHGAVAMQEKLKSRPELGIPIGINIGPNKNARDRVESCIKTVLLVSPYADYTTINISSPNTPGLRDLQAKKELGEFLLPILSAMRGAGINKPVLIKIAPDLTWEQLDDILEVIEPVLQGLIIHNTTAERPASLRSPHKTEVGGASGPFLFERSLKMVEYVVRSGFRLPIIGVGGINSEVRALLMLEAGASLIQILTGFIYEGPFLPYRINRGLLRFKQ